MRGILVIMTFLTPSCLNQTSSCWSTFQTFLIELSLAVVVLVAAVLGPGAVSPIAIPVISPLVGARPGSPAVVTAGAALVVAVVPVPAVLAALVAVVVPTGALKMEAIHSGSRSLKAALQCE